MNYFDTRLEELVAENPPSAERIRQRRLELNIPPQRVQGNDELLPHLWADSALVTARKRARAKGWRYDLSVHWLLRQLEKQGYTCAVSGITFSARRTREGSHKHPFMPSVDRIDCAGGYTTDNVRIVCVAINTLLQDWGDDVYDALVEAIRK